MFLSEEQLSKIGFKGYGTNVLISDKCSIYGASEIELGSNIRIDDFCILSGKIFIGSFVHIACHTSLIGRGGIWIGDYVGISGHCAVYSSSDDFSGNFLTNPMVDEKYTNVKHDGVVMMKHSLVGAGCIILPGAYLREGAAIGAQSLVKGWVGEYTINGGNPLKFIKNRERNLVTLEEQHRNGM